MRQKVGNAEYGVTRVLTDVYLNKTAVSLGDNAVECKGNGRPLILSYTAVIVCLEVTYTLVFVKGTGLKVKAGRIDVGRCDANAIFDVLRTDGDGKEALSAVV